MSLTTSEFSLPDAFVSNRRSVGRWLASYARRYWYYLLVMILGAAANAALAGAPPILIGQAVSTLQQSPTQLSILISTAVWIAITQLIRSVSQFARNFCAELVGQSLERDIRQELYTSLLGKSMTFHNLQPIGDTMARATNDVREINLMFSPGLNLVVGSGIFLLVPLFAATRYHWSLALTPALFIIAYALALWQYLRELDPITGRVRAAFGVLNSRLTEAIDGIETVKGTSQEKYEVKLFENNARRYRDAYVEQGDVEARYLPLLLLGLAEALGLAHVVWLFWQNIVDLGAIVAYFSLLQLFSFPTFISLFAYSQVSLGVAGARRILELINRQADLDQNSGGYAEPLRGEIEFRNVTFAYPGRPPVLEDVSFKIDPGQTAAIVGQTGSGKTTLIKLINRTYDVTQGQVLVDGVDVRRWNLEALRRGVSFIEQDVFLFSRTLADNIAFGKPEADRGQIQAAAQAAQADEFIQAFPDSYDTVIGERGVTLSGGQRQRIALARAFLTDPPVLALDDSTSAIDSATEDRIQRAIYAAAHGRTTLIITHRLSQIRWADQILVLRNGHLAASGSHTHLMESSEAYRRIFRVYELSTNNPTSVEGS
jgi:ATP-binding cassette subfamily B protein